MVTRPLSELSPAYRKRIEAALAKGKTRQSARGHKPKEHIERKRKEIERGVFTSHQKQAITKFAREQSVRTGQSVTEIKSQIIKYTKGDYNRFAAVRRERNSLVKGYKKAGPIGDAKFEKIVGHTLKSGKAKGGATSAYSSDEYVGFGNADKEDFDYEYNFNFEEPEESWFYYH